MASFEQRALGHRDSIMPLDDISHLEGGATQVAQLAKLLTFRLTSNRPKAKAGQYTLAHQLIEADWRVIPLSTSEDPLWEQIGLHSGVNRRVRGEEVRMMNVRACISDVGDIFDGRAASEHVGNTLDQRLRFVERQERRAVKYQGEAYRAYIRKRIMDKTANETLIKYLDEYIRATPLAGEFRWLGRIRRFFAVVYASAAQAIDYEILPWGKKSTFKAIAACMNDAMEQLTAYSGKAASNADAKPIKANSVLLAEFKQYVDKANFVRISRGRAMGRVPARTFKNGDGVIRRTSPGKIECLLFAETLNACFLILSSASA
jgi:hypothetical protein